MTNYTSEDADEEQHKPKPRDTEEPITYPPSRIVDTQGPWEEWDFMSDVELGSELQIGKEE